MKKTTAILAALALLSACAHPNQNRYAARDVGLTADIEFGTVAAVRTVEITGENSGAGAAVGMTAGAVGGSFIGSGDGSIAGLLAGAIIGAVAGAAAEQAMQDRQGIEYVVKLDTGKAQSVVQNIAEGDAPIAVGDRVMVQQQGGYRRVLPAGELDTKPVKAKRGSAK
jgi:outer membrane lipoprotein SlyB